MGENLNISVRSIPARLSLRANFSWVLVGNVVYAGCRWGVLVVLAKLGSPEMVGQFAFGLAVTAPIIMFASLKLRAVQATDAGNEYQFGDYLGLRLITTTLALLAIVGIVLLGGYRLELALVILAVGLVKVFETLSDVFYGLLQRHERMDRIAKSMILRGSLSLTLLSIGIYLTGNVFWGTAGMVIASALILVGYDLRSGALFMKPMPRSDGIAPTGEDDQPERLRLRFPARTLARLAWLALPLGIITALNSLRTNIPRYFIEQYLGERELGIFVAIAYLMVAGNTVAHALGQAASPRLATFYAAGNSTAFRTLLLKLVGVGVLMGGGGVLAALVAGREILTLLYRPEYAERDLFVLLMIAAGISYVATFLLYGVTAARHFRTQMPLFALVLGILVLACLWLIPSTGLYGVATALIIALFVHVVGSLVIVAHILYALHRSTR